MGYQRCNLCDEIYVQLCVCLRSQILKRNIFRVEIKSDRICPNRNQIGQVMSEQKSNRIGYVRIEIKSDRLCLNRNQIGQVMSESKSNCFGSTTSTLIELFIKRNEEINCYIAIVLNSEFSNVFSDNSSKQIKIPKLPLLSHLQGELF